MMHAPRYQIGNDGVIARANLLVGCLMLAVVGFQQAHDIPCGPDTDLHRAASFLINTNIVRGNTLAAQTYRGTDILFSWWDRIARAPGMVQRKPFTLTSWPVDRPRRWVATVNEAIDEKKLESLRTSVNRGRPWGDKAWVQRTAQRLDLTFTFRNPGRPRKSRNNE